MRRIASLAKQWIIKPKVVECDPYKKRRDMLERKLWEVHEGSMKSFGAPDRSEEMIGVLGNICGRRRRTRIVFLYQAVSSGSYFPSRALQIYQGKAPLGKYSYER